MQKVRWIVALLLFLSSTTYLPIIRVMEAAGTVPPQAGQTEIAKDWIDTTEVELLPAGTVKRIVRVEILGYSGGSTVATAVTLTVANNEARSEMVAAEDEVIQFTLTPDGALTVKKISGEGLWLISGTAYYV